MAKAFKIVGLVVMVALNVIAVSHPSKIRVTPSDLVSKELRESGSARPLPVLLPNMLKAW